MGDLLKKIYDSPLAEIVIRWLLGASFVFASFHKIQSPENFAEAVYSYGLFPELTINLIAIIIPFLELFTGLALIAGIYFRAAAIIIGAMLTVFIIALSINLIRGHQFDCGCFSFSSPQTVTSSVLSLVRNIVFLLFVVYVLMFRKNRRGCIQKSI